MYKPHSFPHTLPKYEAQHVVLNFLKIDGQKGTNLLPLLQNIPIFIKNGDHESPWYVHNKLMATKFKVQISSSTIYIYGF